MAKVNVYATSQQIVTSLLPQHEQGHLFWGAPADLGSGAFFSAKPLTGPPADAGETRLDVKWLYLSGADNVNRILVSITNIGTHVVEAYSLTLVWTDVG